MINHVAIQCHDLAESTAFYDTLLAVLGGKRIIERPNLIGYGTSFPTFWIGPLVDQGNQRPIHLAFDAASRSDVDAFHDAARARGDEILHPPRVWPEYHPGYYGAFVRDPDGNNIEAVHHTWQS
jgi:catechol 2,3-dioxygenase-like lactoylglutathione lyase family enzyme